MPGGSSLAKLLLERRRVPNPRGRPKLSIDDILRWADVHHAAHGEWPTPDSGSIPGNEFDTWQSIDRALNLGTRGLPERTSLARLLAKHRGYRNRKDLTPYSVHQILDWADRWHGDFGSWPGKASGAVPYASGETWNAVDTALVKGGRGMPGGDSLTGLLVRSRGIQSNQYRPSLELTQILFWADEHHLRYGKWPTVDAGIIPNSQRDTWRTIDEALRKGLRGIPGGSSLARLLATYRGRRNRHDLPPYSVAQILDWADRWHREFGTWPRNKLGAIPYAPGETWMAVEVALRNGQRGLPGGSSLAKLLKARLSEPPSA